MITSRILHPVGLSALLTAALAVTLAAPASAQIGGVGSAGAPGAVGGGHATNITGAGTGLNSPNAGAGVQPLTGNTAGVPGVAAPEITAPVNPVPAIPTPGVATPGATGTQPVTGVLNAATAPPVVAVPQGGRPR